MVAIATATLLAACAPAAFTLCNSDEDCLRSEQCLDGLCGPLGEAQVGDRSAPANRGIAVPGTLTLTGRLPRQPAPEPEPEPEPTPEPNPDPTLGDLPPDWLDAGLERRAAVIIQGVPGVMAAQVVDLAVLVELDAADLGAAFLVAARQLAVFATVDGQLLASELDSDRGDRMFFWVKHSFDPRSEPAAPERLYVYAGGETSLGVPAAQEVWPGYFGVYHLDAPRNLPQPDSTGARPADNEGAEAETVPCRVGACVYLDGTNDRLLVQSGFAELAGAVTATISATVRLAGVNDAFIAVWSTADRNRSRIYLGTDQNGVPQAVVRAQDASPSVHVAQNGPPLTPGVEHNLDAVLDMAAGTITLFVDGQHRQTTTFSSSGALSSAASAAAAIGASSGGAAIYELDGRVDEVRISAERRSADFVRVDRASRAGLLTAVALDQ